MPNIGSLLKQEISRVARKEIRAETQALKKSTAAYRGQIAALKRRIEALEKQVRKQGRGATRAAAAAPEESTGARNLRFSAPRFAAQRQKLGLSAAAMAKLLGVSALSVYKWESGKTRPRAKQIEAIASLRGLGKREAAERLAA